MQSFFNDVCMKCKASLELHSCWLTTKCFDRERISNTDLEVPELYLYSRNDELTTFASLDKLVDSRMAR